MSILVKHRATAAGFIMLLREEEQSSCLNNNNNNNNTMMKAIFKTTMLLLLLVSSGVYAQRGIGTNTPNKNAILELNSTTKGFLMPRMNEDQLGEIVTNLGATDATGLMVYCTNCTPIGVHVLNGTDWKEIREKVSYTTDLLTVDLNYNSSGTETRTWLRHNLGADYSLDPDVLNKAITGDYYRWGLKDPVATAYTLPGPIPNYPSGSAAPGSWGADKTVGDPCPSGFQVPGLSEVQSLKNYNDRTPIGSWGEDDGGYGTGISISNPLTGVVMTLPAGGGRSQTDGSLYQRAVSGLYWKNTFGGGTSRGYFYFRTNNQFTENPWVTVNVAYQVRCVKEQL